MNTILNNLLAVIAVFAAVLILCFIVTGSAVYILVALLALIVDALALCARVWWRGV